MTNSEVIKPPDYLVMLRAQLRLLGEPHLDRIEELRDTRTGLSTLTLEGHAPMANIGLKDWRALAPKIRHACPSRRR